jgi:peptidyl-prolyl cis-trans isomerase C
MRLPERALESLALALLVPLCVLAAAGGCDEKALDKPAAPSASGHAPSALPPELAQKPLATVGDKVITLGDYAATLERMDQFERLRYQSPERRKQLLDEIIKVELLAAEARRLKLHEDPDTKERIRQILRDEVLKRMRVELPAPGEIPEREVRAYYDQHRDEFREPERRRVAQIVLADRAKAQRVLEQAKKATPPEWGRLVREHSLDPGEKSEPPTAALELAGDLGIVSAPGDSRGANPRVPEPLRKAVFAIDAIGGVHPELVEHDGKFYIVRMTGKSDARDRSFSEAERTIRVTILQKKQDDGRKALEQELRRRFPVEIDEKALEKVEVPALEPSGGATPPAKQP